MQVLGEDDSGLKFVCWCGLDVASEQSLVWEGYMGANIPAFLFRKGINVEPCGALRQESLSTGNYTIVDVRCRSCCAVLGWQYVQAEKADQKYKEECVLLKQASLKRVHTSSSGQFVNSVSVPYQAFSQLPLRHRSSRTSWLPASGDGEAAFNYHH